MKTWTNPTVEELDVKMTAWGDDPAYVEAEGTGPITGTEYDQHFCMYHWMGKECPYGHYHES